MYNKNLPIFLLLCVIIFISGCTLPFVVTNYDEFEIGSTPKFPNPLRLAVVSEQSFLPKNEEPPSQEIIARDLFALAQDGLFHNSQVKTIKYYNTLDKVPEDTFDYAICIDDIQIELNGYTLDYFVTFPGCFFFTCTWIGYHTELVVNTQISIVGADKKTLVKKWKIPTTYYFNHCSRDRGAVSYFVGLGWIMAPFIAFTHTGANDEIIAHTTTVTLKKIYGKYIANKILKKIAKLRSQ